MIKSESRVSEIFRERLSDLNVYAAKHLRAPLFGLIEQEELVMSVFEKTVSSSQMKKGFEGYDHVVKYFYRSIRSNAKGVYFKKIREKVEIPAHVMKRNFDLAKSIIDSHRLLK